MAWDPNQENDLAGYRLHYGSASRDYSQVIDVGNINQYKVSGLLAGTTYYFAITAYNLQGMDSDYSAELAHTTSVTTYTITALAGDNGSITPAGTVTVNQGTNQTFSMHPDQNFQVLNVKVDGVSLGTIKNYTFTDISADHTIEAEFAYIGPAPSPDSDNDGMPDDWEILHGLDPLENDAAGDPDADGISNLNEYLGGTAPNSYDKILNSVQPQLFLLLMSE